MLKDYDSMAAANITRRGFVKGTVAAGAAVGLFGCSKSDSGTDYYYEGGGGSVDPVDPVDIQEYYGSSGHNCGGRCITVAHVSNGRIIRFLTDENKYTADGTYIDPASRNLPQTRACARCRSYKYRLYHPGRLRYPLKQTKIRGDLSGFIRITWDQAYKEIVTKHLAVLKEYGVDGIYQIYACGSVSSEWNGAQSGPIGKTNGYAMKMMGGVATPMFGSYSTHQNSYFGLNYTGADADVNPNSLAKYTNTLVLWGDNSMTTANPSSYASVRAVEDMKYRNPDAKVVYLGPEFVDTAVTLADEWLVQKPFTDPAVIAGMIYHMLDNTFDLTTGALKQDPWLDVDYLDTMVYGFFDSPEYNLDDTTGEIDASATKPNTRVMPKNEGTSYCSWLLGNNNNARNYSDTSVGDNYTARKYAAGSDMKRWSPCAYPSNASSQYYTKKNARVAKTPEWAEGISGIPADSIKELARTYIFNAPVATRWSGGLQKHAEGIPNLYAMQALHIVSKNVGVKGAGFYWVPFTGAQVENDEGLKAINTHRPQSTSFPLPLDPLNPNDFSPLNTRYRPQASCTAWHTALKMAYGKELRENGYTAKYIPNWPKANQGNLDTGDVYWDDGGTRAFIQWERDPVTNELKVYYDDLGNEFYDWKGREGGIKDGTAAAHDGKPVYSGIRLLYNPGGNILINQHENSNDSRDMFEKLPKNDYTDPHSFCLVSIDNFLSPSPRWSDYVLPASTFWEQQDIVAPTNLTPFYTQQVITPPGESKTLWDIGAEMVKTYAEMTGDTNAVNDYFGGAGEPRTVEAVMRKKFNEVKNDATSTSPYKDMTWDEYLKKPFLPSKPDDFTVPNPARIGVMEAFEAFRKNSVDLKGQAFIIPDYPADLVLTANEQYKTQRKVATNEYNQGGYGNQFPNATNVPKSARRFQLYSPVLVWQYENRFSKWHGYLHSTHGGGQPHKDADGDSFVLPIPVYYEYQDYFMEAYGGFQTSNAESVIADLPFLMTTTHNRYRSHSSMAENPLLRELSHRVPGRDAKGNFKPANDFGDYAVAPDNAFAVNNGGAYPPLSAKMNDDGSVDEINKEIVSYSEIWMNEADGHAMDLLDGDLVQVENPIGAVRCVARLTNRCAPGFVSLHQGCWYDPRPLPNSYGHDSVDVGGNCNTLMASQPSRIDHGNGQQSAMVKIFKVDY